MPAPKIVIFQSGANQQWYWHLVAENGQVVAVGEGYMTKANALRGAANAIEDMEKADIEVKGGV